MVQYQLEFDLFCFGGLEHNRHLAFVHACHLVVMLSCMSENKLHIISNNSVHTYILYVHVICFMTHQEHEPFMVFTIAIVCIVHVLVACASHITSVLLNSHTCHNTNTMISQLCLPLLLRTPHRCSIQHVQPKIFELGPPPFLPWSDLPLLTHPRHPLESLYMQRIWPFNAMLLVLK